LSGSSVIDHGRKKSYETGREKIYSCFNRNGVIIGSSLSLLKRYEVENADAIWIGICIVTIGLGVIVLKWLKTGNGTKTEDSDTTR